MEWFLCLVFDNLCSLIQTTVSKPEMEKLKKFTCEVFTYVFHVTGQNVKVSSAIALTLLQIYSEIVNYFQVSELIPTL